MYTVLVTDIYRLQQIWKNYRQISLLSIPVKVYGRIPVKIDKVIEITRERTGEELGGFMGRCV